MDEREEALRDRIYEAAMIPEMWPANCDMISGEVGAYSMALMSISTEGNFRAVSSPHIAEPLAVFLQTDLPSQNIRVQRQMETGAGSFLRDVDLMTAGEIDADPIYEAFLRPRGLGWTAGAVFQEPSGTTLIFDLLRKHELGAFTSAELTKLNRLKADLARASFIATRLRFQEAKTITGTMAALGLPAAVLGEGGKCVAINGELEALAPRIRTGRGDILQFQNAEANKLFQTSLQQLKAARTPEVLSLPLAAGEHTLPLVIHLVPVRRNARDIFSSAAIVMIVTTVGGSGSPSLSVVSGLFDLTRAEARLALELASGRSAEEAAKALSVSVNTVKTHTKAIFRKTGVKRQSELTALLSGLALPAF
ncbi:helix-turn-helix transcriptional regulator [Rhizobium rhizophilum]|uniref:Helix-turn-helix transcriptional regulator n=1 Tax=Rhizobium rhizophilum TaxID=1850373 RepID=A0ABY2QNB0_9HYPH|nr:helix-turn-helix transcriptional regulator [Rhizobium rhizophilum]THV09803.1 helix-turn-helix transcriptional regulator [Rhizobium rhizophilum]